MNTNDQAIRDFLLSERALHYHLRYNHYPPLPDNLIPVCRDAIDKARRGEWDATVSLEGTGFKHAEFGLFPTVRECVELWNLETFLDQE